MICCYITWSIQYLPLEEFDCNVIWRFSSIFKFQISNFFNFLQRWIILSSKYLRVRFVLFPKQFRETQNDLWSYIFANGQHFWAHRNIFLSCVNHHIIEFKQFEVKQFKQFLKQNQFKRILHTLITSLFFLFYVDKFHWKNLHFSLEVRDSNYKYPKAPLL